MIWALFGGISALVLGGLPVFLVLLLLAVGYLVLSGAIPPQIIPQALFNALDKFPLMAVPFFVLAGNLLAGGKLARYIVDAANDWFAWVRGGVGIATVPAYTVLAAMTGSSGAAIASMSPVMVPGMQKAGFPKGFSLAMMAIGGSLATTIPPSLTFILYGSVADVDIARLFMAGVLPGIAFSLVIAGYIWIWSRRHGIPGVKVSWRQRLGSLKRVAFIGTLPVVILGGIYGGFVTPTEAGALAVFYTLVLVLAYRSIKLSALPGIVVQSAMVTAMVFTIVAAGFLFAFIITFMGLPQALTQFIADLNPPLWLFWLLITLLLLLLGCFLDPASLIVITTPMLMPLVHAMNVNPLQYGVVLEELTDIGMLTPPIGVNLFILSAVNKVPVEEIVRDMWPIWLLILLGVVFVIVFPQLSLWLPGTM